MNKAMRIRSAVAVTEYPYRPVWGCFPAKGFTREEYYHYCNARSQWEYVQGCESIQDGNRQHAGIHFSKFQSWANSAEYARARMI